MRPSHPAANVRNDREAPLVDGAGWREMIMILRKTEEKYFCGEGLT
jgi:hypothetical protein